MMGPFYPVLRGRGVRGGLCRIWGGTAGGGKMLYTLARASLSISFAVLAYVI